jgi:hypothetical protein
VGKQRGVGWVARGAAPTSHPNVKRCSSWGIVCFVPATMTMSPSRTFAARSLVWMSHPFTVAWRLMNNS